MQADGESTFEGLELALEEGTVAKVGFTESPRTAFRFREAVNSGMVSINNSTAGAEAHLPFGGNGKSGNGSRCATSGRAVQLREAR